MAFIAQVAEEVQESHETMAPCQAPDVLDLIETPHPHKARKNQSLA